MFIRNLQSVIDRFSTVVPVSFKMTLTRSPFSSMISFWPSSMMNCFTLLIVLRILGLYFSMSSFVRAVTLSPKLLTFSLILFQTKTNQNRFPTKLVWKFKSKNHV